MNDRVRFLVLRILVVIIDMGLGWPVATLAGDPKQQIIAAIGAGSTRHMLEPSRVAFKAPDS